MEPIEEFENDQPRISGVLEVMRSLLLSPMFNRLPLQDQKHYLLAVKDDSTSEGQIRALIGETQLRSEKGHTKSHLDYLPYSGFENIVKRGEIAARDLLSLCNSSPVINDYCNKGLVEMRTGKVLSEYLFRTLLNSEFGIDYEAGDYLSTAKFRDDDAKYLVEAMLAATSIDPSTLTPRRCYDLFNDTFAWILVFKYIIHQFDRSVVKYLAPGIDPRLACIYLISNKKVENGSFTIESNSNQLNLLYRKEIDGNFTVDVFRKVHGENLGLDYDDPLSQHIMVNGKQEFNLLMVRFTKVQRVLLGIPQNKEEKFTWSQNFVDEKNHARGLPAFYGNTVLLDMGNSLYVHVEGSQIKLFRADEILAFYSFMGNNTVPYPMALSSNYVYSLIDMMRIPRSIFPVGFDWANDFIHYYYANLEDKPTLGIQKIPSSTIVKRTYDDDEYLIDRKIIDSIQ